MELTTPDHRAPADNRVVLGVGHLIVGGAALIFGVVLMKAGSSPNAELGGVFLGIGLVVALLSLAFTCAAVAVLRRALNGRAGSLSLVLVAVELVVGAAMFLGMVSAVQGYRAFEPWRSPLLLPSVVLLALGLAGLRTPMQARRR